MTRPPARGHQPLLQFALCALFLPFLIGCATPPNQAIQSIYGGRLRDIERNYSSYDSFRLTADSPVGQKVERNRKINDMLFVIDVNYQQQEGRLYARKAYADFGAKAATLGLSAAGTVVGGTALPALLAATTGALTGTVTAFNSSVLQEQTILAITSNMRKLRAEKLKEIRISMMDSIDEYPIEEALVDLVAYYKSGTFVAALQDLAETAAAKKVKAHAELLEETKGIKPLD